MRKEGFPGRYLSDRALSNPLNHSISGVGVMNRAHPTGV